LAAEDCGRAAEACGVAGQVCMLLLSDGRIRQFPLTLKTPTDGFPTARGVHMAWRWGLLQSRNACQSTRYVRHRYMGKRPLTEGRAGQRCRGRGPRGEPERGVCLPIARPTPLPDREGVLPWAHEPDGARRIPPPPGD